MIMTNYHPLSAFFTIIFATNAVGFLKQRNISVDHAASTSYQQQQTFGIHARNSPTPTMTVDSTIDFASMPTCALSYCIYPGHSASSLPCSTIPAPCPTGSGNNCSTFDHSCYCNLATPLECAFHPCPWEDVMLMENWFNKTCPEVDPSINYNFKVNSKDEFVPSCARQCIQDQVLFYGCTSESKNCFCSHQKLFGCTATCSEADNSTLASWLAATCQITAANAITVVEDDDPNQSEEKEGGPKPPHRPRPLHWYEKMSISVLAITAGVLCIVAFVQEWLAKKSYLKMP